MVASTYSKIQSFVELVAEKAHNLGSDTITIALCAAASAPVATNTVLANLTTISPYTNLSTRVLTTASSSQTSGLYKLDFNDLVLTASGGAVSAFRYIVFYNDTASNDELIGWHDYGSDLTLADGETLTITFDAGGFITLQ